VEVTSEEGLALDGAVGRMINLARERGVEADSLLYVLLDSKLCRKLDIIIAETLFKLKVKVPEDSTDKLFDRMMSTLDEYGNRTLGILFVRYLDTMEYMVSFRGKFRGVDRDPVKYNSKEALRALGMRGLTKK
jgi:hypothetical protein